jgi:glycosyltransferase involved in cell wall biosynthesis/SAM-dependent methyltransferase
MHASALKFGKLFFDTYCSGLQGAVVHDVGAQNVNGSLKDVLPPHLGYVGIDFVAGNDVDIVLEDPYKLPFADGSLDVLVCSSCFEHSQFFWLVFLEMLRVLKPQGLLYLNVPSNGSIHRYPVDCWRFYPDSGRALEAWAARKSYPTQLMESFVGERSPDSYKSGGAWHDFVAVFVKDGRHAAAYPARMLDALQAYSNGYDSRTGAESRPEFLSPDHAELVAYEQAIAALCQEHAMAGERLLHAREELTRAGEELRQQLAQREQELTRTAEQLAQREQTLSALERKLSDQEFQLQKIRSADEAQIRAAHDRLEQILHSRSWRFMAPARKMIGAARVVRSSVRSLAAYLAYRRPGPHSETAVASSGAATEPAPQGSHYPIDAEVAAIRASRMFDERYYRAEYPDLATIADPIRHYCEHGWREGRNPSAEFDTSFYLESNADIREAGLNPFFHYVSAGHREGRFAKREHGARRTEAMLAAEVEAIRASRQFDEPFYRAMNPDIVPPPADAIWHYCEQGWREGRNPSDDFDTKAYLAAYRDIRDAGINPFWHYVIAGASELRQPYPGSSARYEDEVWFGRFGSDVKLLAFHASPNWSLLLGERPLIKGDNQPLLPHADVGFYDPLSADVLREQVALAKRHGVHGFCFGLSLDKASIRTSTTLARLLQLPTVDIAFCPAVDAGPDPWGDVEASFLRRALKDRRAIRVQGLPLLVARVRGGKDDATTPLLRTRDALVEQGVGPVFLVACWSQGAEHVLAAACAAGACDAILDLPDPPVPRETGDHVLLEGSGIGTVPYSVVAAHGVARAHAAREHAYTVYPSVSVGRDGTGSQAARPLVYKRFRADHYRRWLDAAIGAARAVPDAERRFVFLQAWNDWNEGQVLEPDRQGGYGRLNETSRALLGITCEGAMPKVSVIVPNYNHARFLRRRLDSIYGQTYRNIEVILLDDYSPDCSRSVLDEYAAAYPEITRTLYNESNSGAAFRQWAKGIKAAQGDLVWIAESDDYCDERFLEVLVRSFNDEAVLLAYGHSEFVDADGAPMANNFGVYVRDLECAHKWDGPYVETAHREVRASLGIKNTIPNASGVLFRRPVNMALLDDPSWLSMKVAGDWVFYLHAMRGGKVAFDPEATNYFRRYDGSTAHTTYAKSDFYREVGLACRTVARLYDVPLHLLERCREGYRKFYHERVPAASEQEFEQWFDFDAVLRARSERLPNVIVSTMGFFPGGAEIFPIRLANEFKRQGVSVLLLSTGLNPREDGVRRMLRNDVPLVETSDVEPVRQIIEQFGLEVLNTHQWYVQKYPVQVADVFAGLRSHVATLHGMIEHGNAFSVTEKELRTADGSVSTWVYTADKNLGPFYEFGMVQGNESRFVKMPNGIQTPRIEPVPRAQWGIPEDAFVLCCVSRAIPDKGWAETVASVERAREITGRDIRLVLVGNGSVYDEYRVAGVPHFVHLVGFSENSAGHYASADMGIMLTRFRSESFPLTIVDCLFAGKPYIATSVGDIPNMLSSPEGMAGGVIELNDWQVPVEEVAQMIAAFATDYSMYLAAKARVPQIASRYRIEAVASLYVDVFRKASGMPTSSADAEQATNEFSADVQA